MNTFIKQISKFASVGVITVVISVTLNFIFLDILSLPLYPVYISVYCFGIIISYLLNTYFTFKKKRNVKDSVQYAFIYAIGLIFGIGLLAIFQKILPGYSDFMYTLFVIIPRFVLTFMILKLSIFKT